MRRRLLGAGLFLLLGALNGPAGAQTGTASPAGDPPPPVLEILDSVSTGGIETRAVALILSGQQGGGLASEFGAFPRPGGGVDLVVELDGAGLVAGPGDGAGDRTAAASHGADGPQPLAEPVIVEIYAYALDAEGGVRGYLTEAFRIADPTRLASLASGGVKFLGRMALGAGDYSVRILVLERRADRFALTAIPVHVPGEAPAETTEAQVEAIPFVVLEPVSPWIVVRQPDRAGATPTVGGGPPWLAQGSWWVPAVHPVRAAGTEISILFDGEPPAAGRLLDVEDRQPVYEVGLVAGSGPKVAGYSSASLPAPSLDAGEYLLQTGDSEAPARPLRLVPGPGAPPWFVAAAGGTDRLDQLLGSPPEGRGRALDDGAKLRTAYAKALLPLTGETPDEALASVADFERSQVGDGTPVRMARLTQAEAQTANQAVEAAGGDPRVLLPLLWLHEQLYRGYHHRGEFLLAVHSRQLVVRLGELYVKRAEDPAGAAADVAELTANIAGYLQEIGASLAARQAFERALDLDGNNVAALLGLAVLDEAYGDYPGAAGNLRRLLKLRPDSAEAQLRLAVNLRRTGAVKQAAELLEACTKADRPTWVRTIAFEERATLEDEAGRPAEAVAWLRRALTDLPEEPRPKLQLASLLDRLGQPAAAAALVEALASDLPGAGPTARFRYSRWPRWALLEGYRRFETRVDETRAVLTPVILRLNGRAPAAGPETEASANASTESSTDREEAP
ncbi:MAG: tetratricopeptide repeat protein [Acidobacteria bacterium]|nr:tetratricopeptide repeat protein [Acidobacteriota bacterium]